VVVDVIVVCHTEFGFVHKAKVIPDKSAWSGVADGVKNLVTVANEYDAKVTFAVMPEVAMHFPKDIGHEVGLHIHPGWQEHRIAGFKYSVGDAYLRKHCRQPADSLYLHDYAYQDQLEAITIGKDYLTEVLGIEPKTFVAGMWSLNNDTVKALVESGFTHDCSVPPHSKTQHYDYLKLPRICMPYRPRVDDYQEKGDLPVLIVPISQSLRAGNVNPEVVPVVGLPWLKACFREYYNQNVPLFHICLHSPCMTDPYFIAAMDELLKYISKHDVEFRFASEVEESGGVVPKPNTRPYLLGFNKNMIITSLKFFRAKVVSISK